MNESAIIADGSGAIAREADPEALANVADDLLTYMTLSKPGRVKTGMAGLSMSYFAGAIPWTTEWLNAQYPAATKSYAEMKKEVDEAAARDALDDLFDVTPEPGEAIDACTLNMATQEGSNEQDPRTAFGAVRLRRRAPQELRGKVTEVWPLTCEYAIAFTRRSDGVCVSSHRTYVAWTPKGWKVVGAGMSWSKPHHACYMLDVLRTTRVAMLTHRLKRSCWQVQMSLDGGPSVSFLTDALGVREVFRLRDVPNGKTRRAALCHWVSEHWRTNRKVDPVELHHVRAHLRGAKEFTWNGLGCKIVPSACDLEFLSNPTDHTVVLPQMPLEGLPPPAEPLPAVHEIASHSLEDIVPLPIWQGFGG